MKTFNVLLSRAARQYRTVEGIQAETHDQAKRIAMRISRLLDSFPGEATFDDLGLDYPCDIGEWGTYGTETSRQRVEDVKEDQ